jgi:hypothetical protein
MKRELCETATALCVVLTEFVLLLGATSQFSDKCIYLQSSDLSSRQCAQGFGLHVAVCSEANYPAFKTVLANQHSHSGVVEE